MTETATALTFIWLGMVLAISFLEAPLKFRAPGVTLPLGLGIGRLVFNALNIVEVALSIGVVSFLAAGGTDAAQIWLTAAVIGCLAVQIGAVRPVLNRRTNRFLSGETPAGSKVHLIYIALELIKVGLLIALGIALS